MKQAAIPALILILLGACVLRGQGEEFYRSAMKEGLAHYHEGRYDQAMERLRLAGFGLLDKPAVMRRIHAYSALTFFRLSRFADAKASLGQLSGDPRSLPRPEWGVDEADEDIFRVMLRTLYPGEGQALPTGIQRSFELVFADTLEKARKGEWDAVKAGVGKLADLAPGEPRIAMLEGMREFAQGRFADAYDRLDAAKTDIQAEFHDELLFYFARACERVGRYGAALAAVEGISDPERKRMLAPLVRAIAERRERDVARLARAFSRADMRRLMDKFPGDRGLAAEIWVQAVRAGKATPDSREELIFNLARFAAATNRHFFIQAAEYLALGKRSRQALRLLERSPYAADNSRENVPFMYTMGTIRQATGDREGAVEWMQRILRIMPEYEPAQVFLTRKLTEQKENP